MNQTRNRPPPQAATAIQLWLAAVILMIFAMVIVGGATRLTDSGLSITEWQPITGFIPPLSEAAWNEAFAKYREIPEYTIINRGMSLAAFKAIYWWEWAHRFLGRIIGLVFALPLAFFWLKGWLPGWLKQRALVLLALGAAQGALGWFMVKSGLAERTDVSQYRLAAHLALAVAIYALAIWTLLSVRQTPGHAKRHSVPDNLRFSACALLGLTFLQVTAGGFVAGIDAGQGYNTWPLMLGSLVPDGLWAARPWYANFFENALAIQFNHRMLAYLLIAAACAHFFVLTKGKGGALTLSAGIFVCACLAQAGIGIATLLMQVPLSLGLLHQAGALVLVAAGVWHCHRMFCGK